MTRSFSNTKKVFDVLILPLLILCGLALYGFALRSPFQLDDHELMLASPLTRSFDVLFQNLQTRKIISFFTFAANYRFGGQDPFGFHAVNLVLHVLAGFCVFAVVRKIFDSPHFKREIVLYDKRELAVFGSLIFLAHPLQTESVTYIWQRTEIVSALFYLWGYFFYLKGRISKNKVFYFLSAFVFLGGLAEKGTVITLPVLILTTEWLFFDSKKCGKILATGALGCAALVMLLRLPLEGLQKFFEKLHIALMTATNIQLSYEYMITEFGVLVRYLALTFFPWGQNVEHDVRLATSFFSPQVCWPFLALIAIFVLIFKNVARHRLAVFGAFWYFIYLLPTSLIYREPMWEHRLYLSLAGFGIFVCAAVFKGINNGRLRRILLISLVLALGTLTVFRNTLWLSPQALLEDAARKSPSKGRVHQQLGVVYLKQGRLDEAGFMFRKAIRLDPGLAESYNNLGVIYAGKKLFPEAEAMFQRALRVRPGFVPANLNLGDLAIRGFFADYEKGKWHFEQVIFQKPFHVRALVSLAEICRMEGDFARSLEYGKRAVRADQRAAEGYLQMGLTYESLKDFGKARMALLKAHRLAPGDVRAVEALVKIADF